jgi:thymidylate synthase ThyX
MNIRNNSVELLGYYGSDEVIACSAWTSTNRELTEEKKERIPKLINMLWSEGHETPFEKGTVHFLVNCDIASHIHLLKHRIASINAESARYKELKEDKFYLPEDFPEKWRNKLVALNKFDPAFRCITFMHALVMITYISAQGLIIYGIKLNHLKM